METKVNATPKIVAAEVLLAKEDAYIETVAGRKFYFFRPDFDLGEIAHALGNICRFTGQSRKFYSVAEHSVLVSRIMEDLELGNPVEGLLHDAVEAYMADMSTPAKSVLKDYRALEGALDKAMRKQFNLPLEKTQGCIEADWMALFIEANVLLPTHGKDWRDPAVLRARALKLPYVINGWTPQDATGRFMTRLGDVNRRRRQFG
jgi:hypothetical protein